jgi:hypothetical protein
MKRISAAALFALLALAPSAHTGDEVWEAGTTSAGGPRLAVHDRTVFEAEPYSVQVFRCPNGGSCDTQPLASTAGDYDDYGAQRVDLGSAAAGDVFEARFSRDGAVVRTERTAPWLGDYVLTRAPSVAGQPVADAVVSGDAGAWAGGWGERWQGASANTFAACRLPEGVDCVEFSPFYPTAKLESRWTGWYVFAISNVSSGHHGAPIVTEYGYPSYPNPIARLVLAGNQALSAAFGPIAAASGPQPTAPRPQPAASVRSRALRAEGRLLVGRVSCPERCVVKLTVSGGGKTIRRTLNVIGTKALTVPRRHGRLKVTINVNGKRLASGTSRAR